MLGRGNEDVLTFIMKVIMEGFLVVWELKMESDYYSKSVLL